MASAEEFVAAKIPEAADPPLAAVSVTEDPKHLGEEKAAAIPPSHPSLAAAIKVSEPDVAERSLKESIDRDVALAKLEDEKRLSFVKAWEESQKSQVENKAQKKASEIDSWENTRKASLESQLLKKEEKLVNKKANYAERVRNKVAQIHKQAEEKRAMVESDRAQEILKTEEMAGKYRATGHTPKKGGFGCF